MHDGKTIAEVVQRYVQMGVDRGGHDAHDRFVVGRRDRIRKLIAGRGGWAIADITFARWPTLGHWKKRDRHRRGDRVGALPPVVGEIVELSQIVLFDKGQNQRPPSNVLASRVPGPAVVQPDAGNT